MKSFIGVILLSYVFLLIYSKHIVGSYDYEQHDTNNETAYKAANFCLEYYNKQNNESYILTKVEFAINETFAPNSYINLYFNGKKTNSNKEVEFQAIYQPRKNREPKCNIVLIDTSGVT
ncbi:Hypothetical protein SRAE_1000301200 [Strongyloides ratti]|uniref:Cystatin domain-containing protein n=1 Tax=Strongyloides ratti TaxID=34506 RepID=A0A090L9G6_STRRB|nr:Hypothetical protein SRAE_1000301200 [Strongyloides ratti]CEF64758.1 Hypothetical protein SRAE_1000301200 [Strongyloides ratti]